MRTTAANPARRQEEIAERMEALAKPREDRGVGLFGRPMTRRRGLLVAAVAFVASFLLELWLALPQGLSTKFFGVPLTTSIHKLLPILGESDSGSYLGAALDLQDGHMSPAHSWVLNLWPPGMPVLLATLIKIGGGASPILAMVILLCVLWSITMAIAAVLLISRGGIIATIAFAVVWIASPIFTAWTTHNGVLGSDGLATAIGSLVAITFIWVSTAPHGPRPRYGLYVALGASLAALAYLRIMWYYAVPAALGALLAIVAIRLIILRIRGRHGEFRRQRRDYIEWGALALTFVILCAPWTIYVGTVLHPGNYQWSTGDYQWAQEWTPPATLIKEDGGFIIAGGGTWPCQIDPAECATLRTEELATKHPYSGSKPNTFHHFELDSVVAAVTHPIAFIGNRATFTVKAWLSTPGASVGTFGNIGFGLLTLLCFLVAIGVLIAWSIRTRAGPLLVLLILGANMAVLWLTHFETRYVVPLQAMSIVVVALWLAPYEGRLWARLAGRRRGDVGDVAEAANQSDGADPVDESR